MTPAADGAGPAPAPPVLRSLKAGQRFAGAVDYLDPVAGLRGWLVDLERPGEPVELAVRCQGELLATAWAMMDRPEIDKLLGRLSQCGFLIGWSRFDAAVLERLAGASPEARLEVFAAATGQLVQVTWGGLDAARAHALVSASPAGDRQRRFRDVNEYRDILDSGLFDAGWYTARHGAAVPVGMPPLLHFIRTGEAAGHRPNFYFDPATYARAIQIPTSDGALIHFIRNAALTGAVPGPHFDAAWYVARHEVPRGAAALAHFLARRDRLAPNRWFDPDFYAEVSGAGPLADPYEHFVRVGHPAGLPPSRAFVEGIPAGADAWLAEVRRETAPAAAPSPPVARQVPAAAPPVQARTVPEAPPPSPTRSGFAETEAALRVLPRARLDSLRAAAERELAAGGPGRADAALLLAILHGLDGNRPAAAQAAAAYLADPPSLAPAIRNEIEKRLLAANHALHEERRGPESERVYRLLHGLGRRDWLLVLRLLQSALDRRDLPAAGPLAVQLESMLGADLSPWGVVALARHDILRGDRPAALARLTVLPPYPAHDATVEAVVLNAMIDADGLEHAAQRAERSAGVAGQEIFGAHLRIAVRRLDVEGVTRLLEDPRASRLPSWQIAEAIYVLGAPSRVPLLAQQRVMARLYPLAEARGTTEPGLVHARAQYLLLCKRWQELGALLARIADTPLASQPEMLLRRLEYLCGIGSFDSAWQLYGEHFADRPLTKWEGLTVLRLLGEVGRWQEAAQVLAGHLGRGYDVGSAVHLALRVVRRADAHRAVLAAAAEAPAHRESGGADLLAIIEEDLLLREAAGREGEDARPPRPRSLRRGAWGLLAAGQGEVAEASEHCLILCSNRRYFLSLLTFLASCFGQSPQTGARVFVFLDRDVPEEWHPAIATVAGRFGREVEVVAEAEFMPEGTDHRVAYGFFTGGNMLARSAYFRLYAIRWLLARHDFRRGAYVDTDTVCRGDLSGLLRFDLSRNLIAAATEDYSAEVVGAAARNGLDPFAYFNSGVLVLRLDDPELGAGIEAAIRVSEEEPERLVFHDQCALNIAFAGKVQPLPARYNFFLRPSRDRNGPLEDAVLLHFLDKPKPWDLAFDRGYREEWRVWALLVSTLISPNLYISMLSAGNRE